MRTDNNRKSSRIKTIVLSLIVSVLVWAAVIYIEPPEMSTTISNLPVRVSGERILKERNLTTVDLKSISGLTVTVKGKRTDLLKLSGGIYVDVDVSSITESGEYNLTGNVTLPSSKLTIDNVGFESVPITVDKVIEKDIEIKTETTNTATGMLVKTEPDQKTVTITGAKSEVDEVAYGFASVDAGKIAADAVVDSGYVLMTDNGTPITKNETIEASEARLRVNCDVYNRTTLTIKPILSEELSKKYEINTKRTTVIPETVEVGLRAGVTADKVEYKITEIGQSVKGEFVEKEGIYIPESSRKVTVNLSVDALVSKTVSVEVKPENLAGGYIAEINKINVTVTGTEENLNAGNISASVDLNGYGTGIYSVPVVISGNNLSINGSYMADVTIIQN